MIRSPRPPRRPHARIRATSFALRVVLLTVPLAAALTGCLRPVFPEDKLPVYEERPVYGTFNTSYELVWDAALKVMGDRYPVSRVDQSAGVIATEWVHGTSDYIYNKFSGTRIPEKVRFKIHMEVQNRNDKVEVQLLNHEQVEKDIISANLEFTGAIYEWVDVPSSTLKERQILQEVLDIIEGRYQESAESLN